MLALMLHKYVGKEVKLCWRSPTRQSQICMVR